MAHNSDGIQFPILYLILPTIIGLASAIPAGDMVLRVTGIEPTSAANVLARGIAGLFIGTTLLLVMVRIGRSGKN